MLQRIKCDNSLLMVPQTLRPTLENRKRLKNADLPESMSQLETIARTDLSQAFRRNVPVGTWPFSYCLISPYSL